MEAISEMTMTIALTISISPRYIWGVQHQVLLPPERVGDADGIDDSNDAVGEQASDEGSQNPQHQPLGHKEFDDGRGGGAHGGDGADLLDPFENAHDHDVQNGDKDDGDEDDLDGDLHNVKHLHDVVKG